MRIRVNYFSDDLVELSANISQMCGNWKLAPFILWNGSGSVIHLELMTNPEATGNVVINVEMLPKSLVEKLLDGKWVFETERPTIRISNATFGIGVVEHTLSYKTHVQSALKGLNPPKEVLESLRAIKVSRDSIVTKEFVEEEDESTTFKSKTIDKAPHAVTSWSSTSEDVNYDVTLDISYDKNYDRVNYNIKVAFDLKQRQEKLFTLLEGKGFTLMNGTCELSQRF